MKSTDYFAKLFSDIKKLPKWFQDESIEDSFFLVSAMRPGGQHHFHARLPEHLSKEEFIAPALEYLGYNIPQAGKKPDFKSVEFVSRLALGDAMMMTSGIRDFHAAFPDVKIKVRSTAMHVWDNNPYISQDIEAEKTFNVGTGWLTNASNRLNLHMANAYRVSIQNETGLVFEQGPIRPDIWLSEEEYNAPPIIEGPYWVIVKGGEAGWPLKMYPIESWQAVVDSLPQIKFVELGTQEHISIHGKLKNNKGNLIEMVGKTQDPNTGIRDLFKIFLHAQGSVGLVSMHMHLSAAFNNPCVVVAGAREPAWFTQYFGHIYLHTNGLLPCAKDRACWHCSTPTCKNLKDDRKTPRCVDIIKPEEVAGAIRKYYDGGRLEYGKKIPNTHFRNIARGPGKSAAVARNTRFTGLTISSAGWDALERLCKETAPQRILEYGPGLSTELFRRYADVVHSIESLPDKFNTSLETLVSKPSGRYDFAFIDGPKGAWSGDKTTPEHYSRFSSVQEAIQYTDCIIMHNAFRDGERAVCDLLLKGWQKNDLHVDRGMVMYSRSDDGVCADTGVPGPSNRAEVKETVSSEKLVKILTSCRGFGGSEKSTLMLMRMFQEDGYEVQLCPWGGTDRIGGAYRNAIPEGVIVDSNIVSPCEMLVYYTTDTIYFKDFDAPEFTKIMKSIQAKRKVMVCNYRLGNVGRTEWTKGWDKYGFLCSQKREELQKRIPEALTFVLPPPTDLSAFFGVERTYKKKLHLIRHNAQGDAKWPRNVNEFIGRVWEIEPKIELSCMPPASFLLDDTRIHKYRVNQEPIHEFLSHGNCFIYNLPDGYQDQGPRVIMEAMATGLPVIADNRWGAKDRVTTETGWLCDNEGDYLQAIRDIIELPSLLKTKGMAARKYAKKNFDPHRWIEEILK